MRQVWVGQDDLEEREGKEIARKENRTVDKISKSDASGYHARRCFMFYLSYMTP